MSFEYKKWSREQLTRRHASTTRVMADLFAAYRDYQFPANAATENPLSMTDLANALIVLYTEAGVRALFSKPEVLEQQIVQAHNFLLLSWTDNGYRYFDDHTTIAIFCILQLFPIQNNRREARRKEIEKFLTRDLTNAIGSVYPTKLHELLFSQEYAYSRWITIFRHED
ncbi:hypothetical protein D3C81_144750 [compost metagenome]|jgi:hypothetical protein